MATNTQGQTVPTPVDTDQPIASQAQINSDANANGKIPATQPPVTGNQGR